MNRFRRWLTAALAVFVLTTSALAVTYLGSDAEFHAVSFADLPNINANSVFGNATNSAATGTSVAVPTCSLLAYTGGTGFSCGSAATGTLVSINAFSSSQTITIPAGATKAFVRMWGGTGGSGGVSAGASGGTGAAGYLEKYLTGLTAGNTVVFTQGAAGAAGAATPTSGGNGTASTLASGTQTITTLTANGSNGSASATSGESVGTVGGTATNGDLNVTGQTGASVVTTRASTIPGGSNHASLGADGVVNGSTTQAGNAGNAGGMVIFWFT